MHLLQTDPIPVVLIIDPVTDQKMHSGCEMVQPESLLEGLVTFLDAGPKDRETTMSDTCPRGGSSPPKTKAVVDSDGSKEKDDEVQRALAASSECMKESSAIAGGDNNKHEAIAVNLQETALPKRPTYPTLPEEPKAEKNLLCRVSVRRPDGRRVQRNFLRSDSIQLQPDKVKQHMTLSNGKLSVDGGWSWRKDLSDTESKIQGTMLGGQELFCCV